MKGIYELLPNRGKHRFREEDGTVRIMRSGDRVECHPEQLAGLLHRFRVVDEPPPPEQPSVGLKLLPRGAGWYDVVNETTGVKLNSQAMRKEDALDLLGSGLPDMDEEDDGAQETFDLSSDTPRA